jgi:hypothetical protein
MVTEEDMSVTTFESASRPEAVTEPSAATSVPTARWLRSLQLSLLGGVIVLVGLVAALLVIVATD